MNTHAIRDLAEPSLEFELTVLAVCNPRGIRPRLDASFQVSEYGNINQHFLEDSILVLYNQKRVVRSTRG